MTDNNPNRPAHNPPNSGLPPDGRPASRLTAEGAGPARSGIAPPDGAVSVRADRFCAECGSTDLEARHYAHTVVLICGPCGHAWSVGLSGDGITR